MNKNNRKPTSYSVEQAINMSKWNKDATWEELGKDLEKEQKDKEQKNKKN